MKRKWIVVIGIIFILLGVSGFLISMKLNPPQAGIQIDTTPQSTVYMDGQQVGNTPYQATKMPGEITLRLVPVATGKTLAPWETKVTLTQGINTIVKRDFGDTLADSAGEILSFEKISGNLAGLAVVSTPDSSQVSLDGDVKGYTPLTVNSVSVGDHKLLVTQSGFQDREILAKTAAGYKLTVVAMLAQNPLQASSSATPSPSQIQASPSPSSTPTTVKILNTPTGFLRVRMSPSSAASEEAQVKPGSNYPYVGESKDKSWIEIEYRTGKDGWVSAQYTQVGQ